jgi:hypothetical protein
MQRDERGALKIFTSLKKTLVIYSSFKNVSQNNK